MLKKLTSSLLVGLMLFSTVNAYAFGGYSHWDIATKVAANKQMGSTTANYYKSGALLADIGKSTWDNSYTTSDSKNFSDKMLAVARKTKFSSSLNFASGWVDHYIQDNKGTVLGIGGAPSPYRVGCGWVDEYLRDSKAIRSPINGTANAYADYYLIRETYNQLNGFAPTDAAIDTQISKLYSLYDLQIACLWLPNPQLK